MSDSTFYVTTPIYYVNGKPHLGHAYTTLAADLMARYWRARSRDVHFLTGTDEHGLKVMRAAEKEGITPQAIADRHMVHFQKVNTLIGSSIDDFIRTTEPRHIQVAQELWRRVRDAGDITLGTYEGWYAPSDEAYYKEEEIEDGHAIVSGSKVEWVKESSYFFKLSTYQERLLAFYDAHPHFIQPESRRNEVIRFVEGGLNDLSISRTTFDWGVPVPDDPDHVMYVWFDALTNYISALGLLSGEDNPLTRFWPASVHIVGKDIIRFHAVFWPAFLMSAGLEPPQQIWAHGWWMTEKVKMSKSKGNIVDPFTLFATYQRDVLRYFLFREIPFGNDGTFSEERILARNNSELANTFGNLVNRGLQMSVKFLDGIVPDVSEIPAGATDLQIQDEVAKTVAAYHEHLPALA
ncbi:MAG: class I tRNA ligase family protein, partial [Myxococcota bacterium]